MSDDKKRKYKKNYLTQVIYQTTFEHTDITEDVLKQYKTDLGDDFGELSSVQRQGILITNEGSKVNTTVEDDNVWQIISKSGDFIVVVTHESFEISFKKYEKFRVYAEIIAHAQTSFFKLFPSIKSIKRLGLRYVNQIEPPVPDVIWSDYINEHLISSLSFVDSKKLRRAMHSMVIEEDEGTYINVNYGVFNQYFPQPILNQPFIIDLDAYTPNVKELEPSECGTVLEKFNKTLAIYFESLITDKLREVMEVIDEQAA